MGSNPCFDRSKGEDAPSAGGKKHISSSTTAIAKRGIHGGEINSKEGPMKELRPCPECKSTDIVTMSGSGPMGLGSPYWVRCNECGFETEARFDEMDAEAVWNVTAQLKERNSGTLP